ncbi:MAG: hypothetical protein AB1Z98_04985 [Nannocystaceae bacterium]
MPIVCSLAVVALLGWTGPPKLPPLPGEQPPPPPTETEPAKPDPTRQPKVLEPTAPPPRKPLEPTQPPLEPALKPAPWATPSEPRPEPSPAPSIEEPPGVVEPPQPETRGPEPETETEKKGDEPDGRRPQRGGPGSAPSMSPELLPGDAPPPAMLRLPPPRRPPYSGVGLFIGAGVTFSIALTEQIVGHVLVKRRCIDPFDNPPEPDPMAPADETSEAEDFGDVLLRCAPGVLPAVALRVQSDLGLLATIGLVSAGAALRARRRAYDDVFGDVAPRRMLGLRVGGISLMGLGVVTWLTTGAVSWGLLATCRDARCATRARLVAFTTRDAGAVLIAGGAGMLTYALAHGRAYDRFFRDRALSVGTAVVPGGAGLSLSGRF